MLPLQPLVYALAFGSCLGGNGSLVGASCNLVAAGISEQHGYKITFGQFFKTGFPIMISSILVAIIYVCIVCIYFEWY
ncbi:P isoform X1 [Brachionus plicatilis]|uniref:P isoform X1 n=1 Tax=Brachionus plicatilis TaxID=10195 RepID=A0A3M7QA23_BRAPC|nr:P isoform X1 [Brachionus plicatilis]